MANIFEQALPFAGAAAGFVAGGPGGAALGFSIGSAVGGISQQQEAQSQQAKATRAQKRIADLQAARQRTQQVRSAIVQQGTIENVSAATGTGSSRAAGASASLSAQLASNLAFSAQTEVFSGQASSALQRSANAATESAIFNTLASTAFSIAGGARFGSPAAATSSQGTNLLLNNPNRNANIGFQPNQQLA